MFPHLAKRQKLQFVLTKIRSFGALVSGWLESPKFFYFLVGIFTFQAIWIALSARYPQAFDENFHFGLIQLHAQQWLPFFTSQPPNAEVYGPVSRDPSYFYHYILSLPYRVMNHYTNNQIFEIIVLRFINIAMFIWGLFVYRELFSKLGISQRLRNVVLLFFVLTPIVPLLASQINYDNLVFPLTGLLFLYTVRYVRTLKDEGRINVQLLLELILYGLFAGIVKYTSLPLFAAIMAIVAFYTIKSFERRNEPFRKAFVIAKKWVLVVYAVLFVIFGGLFIERYGVNLVRYHTPAPDCAVVLTDDLCESYAPWARDHLFAQTLPRPTRWEEIVYPFVWVHRMVFETMFVISSFDGDDGVVHYVPAAPLTVADYTAWVVVLAGFVFLIFFVRKLWRMRELRLLLLAIVFYGLMLFLKNFSSYLYSGEAVAIHGRYLVPMYPVLYLMLALGFGWFFQRIKKPHWQPLLVVLVLVPFLEGAGLVGWIFRSDPTWYWSQNHNALVYRINQPVQNIVHHIIIP